MAQEWSKTSTIGSMSDLFWDFTYNYCLVCNQIVYVFMGCQFKVLFVLYYTVVSFSPENCDFMLLLAYGDYKLVVEVPFNSCFKELDIK